MGEKLNEHINIGLSDHIAFAAENIQNNIIVRNKLLSEIEILYSEEFAIAQWAVEYLTQTLEIPFSYDEAGILRFISIVLAAGVLIIVKVSVKLQSFLKLFI